MTIEEVKRQITHWVEKWYPVVGDMRLDVNIDWASSPDIRSGCEVNESYLYCELQFSPTRVIAVHTNTDNGQLDLEAMEQEVIHECAHTIGWRMAQRLIEAEVSEKESRRLEEQVTSMIDRAIWKAYQLGREECQTSAPGPRKKSSS